MMHLFLLKYYPHMSKQCVTSNPFFWASKISRALGISLLKHEKYIVYKKF